MTSVTTRDSLSKLRSPLTAPSVDKTTRGMGARSHHKRLVFSGGVEGGFGNEDVFLVVEGEGGSGGGVIVFVITGEEGEEEGQVAFLTEDVEGDGDGGKEEPDETEYGPLGTGLLDRD